MALNPLACGSGPHLRAGALRRARLLLLPALLAAATAQAAIGFVSASSVASPSATDTLGVPRPAGLAAGDLMLALISQRGGDYPLAQTMRVTPPGWSVVVSVDDGDQVGLSVYRKLASASEPASYAWTLAQSERTALAIVAFRGVDGNAPIGAGRARRNNPSSTYSTPSLTTGVAGSMLVALFSAVNGNGSVNAANGMSAAFSIGSGAGPNGLVIGGSYALQAAAGGSGSKRSTGNAALLNLGALVALNPGAAAAGPDHYELTLPDSSINCLPSQVSVTACADSSSPCSKPYTGAGGSTARLSASGGSLAASTLSFDASGVAGTTLRYPNAADPSSVSVTLSGEQLPASAARQCCPNGSGCSVANSCTTVFNNAGFIVAASAGGAATTIPAQTAGRLSAGYSLRAVRSNTSTGACAAALSGAGSVNWAYQCNDPARCSAGNLMRLNGSTIARNDSGAVGSFTPVPMVFDADGNAPFSFEFGDVGRLRLWASRPIDAATLSGATNAFVTRPAAFGISAIAQSASPFLANPGAAGAAGAAFVRAGESFSARITALSSSGAATPNYGRESSPEGVRLSATLVAPAGGAAGVLANANVAGASFVDGVAQVDDLAWDEVGIIRLSPAVADGDYLGSGDVVGAASGNIGRFIPDHFAIGAGSAQPACSGAFSYFGQDGFDTTFTLRAENRGNALTRNHEGGFARLVLTDWNSYAFSAAGLPAGALLAASATAPTGGWSQGQASVVARHQVGRPTAPAAETLVMVKAAPLDSDGVTMAASAVAAATPLRFGRLRLANAFGSEKAALAMAVQAQYWSGNSWVANGADSCSRVPAAAVVRAAYFDARGAPSNAWTTTPGAINIAGGSATLLLSAPSPPQTGSVDIALNLGTTATDQSCLGQHPASSGAGLPWLRAQQGGCAAGWDRDPAARASFGIHAPETRRTLHVRELY